MVGLSRKSFVLWALITALRATISRKPGFDLLIRVFGGGFLDDAALFLRLRGK